MLASFRGRAAPHHSPQGNGRTMCAPTGLGNEKHLRQHRTIPALRLKHRSDGCGTASALPKCSIMSGCGTPHRASGAKAPRALRPLPLLRFAVSATGGAHLCSIQYYLRFWLSSCRTSLAVSAFRIMRYCRKMISNDGARGLDTMCAPTAKIILRMMTSHRRYRRHLNGRKRFMAPRPARPTRCMPANSR